MARVVIFGATGYTGGLVAEGLVAAGVPVTLAGRDRAKLDALVVMLGATSDIETVTADASAPGTLAGLLDEGDVLVSTVGPFGKYGEPAVRAAVDAGAHYLDSTGEGAFIRDVFSRFGPEAAGRCGLIPAFGYDFVPGNLAGALAMREGGDAVHAVDVGYFMSGKIDARSAMSSGTMATMATMATSAGFTFRDGRLQPAKAAQRVGSFDVEGRKRVGMSIPATEHLALPRLSASLQDIEVYLGWFGKASYVASAMTRASAPLLRIPGATRLIDAATKPLLGRTGIGPDAEERSTSFSLVVGRAKDAAGETLAEVVLRGPNGYTLTGDFLVWGAQAILDGCLEGRAGGLGPVDAFGLDALEQGAKSIGLVRV